MADELSGTLQDRSHRCPSGVKKCTGPPEQAGVSNPLQDLAISVAVVPMARCHIRITASESLMDSRLTTLTLAPLVADLCPDRRDGPECCVLGVDQLLARGEELALGVER